MLLLRGKRVSWTAYWGKRKPLEIDEVPELVERDGNTVRCAMASGRFDFAVPKFDVPLVLDFFERLLVEK